MARTGPSTVSQVSSPGRPKDINSSLKAIGSQEVSGGILKLDLCAAKASVLNATLPHHYASILTLGKKPSTFNFLSLSPTIPLTQHVHIHPEVQPHTIDDSPNKSYKITEGCISKGDKIRISKT